MRTDPIVVEQAYNAPRAVVWSAISEKDQMRQWFFKPMTDFEPEVGFETEFDAQYEGQTYRHQWKVTEVVPERRITYGWGYEGYGGDSSVTWELSETPDGTKLRLTHDGHETFPRDNPVFRRDRVEAGWRCFLHERLKAFLERQNANEDCGNSCRDAMRLTEQIANHLRELHVGGNWTGSSLRDQLAEVTWEQATTRVNGLHTVAALVYHMNYFVAATLKVMQGGTLDAKDKFSFDHPPIASQQDWESLLEKTWSDAENLALAMEQMPESQLWEHFVDEKWGSYYRCLHGPIEHCYYHLGQIALLKTILTTGALDGDINPP